MVEVKIYISNKIFAQDGGALVVWSGLFVSGGALLFQLCEWRTILFLLSTYVALHLSEALPP